MQLYASLTPIVIVPGYSGVIIMIYLTLSVTTVTITPTGASVVVDIVVAGNIYVHVL
jgi:hypothetical protein